MSAEQGKPVKRKRRNAIVTIKGKPREVDLTAIGLGRLRLDIIKWKGHKQIDITALDDLTLEKPVK